MLCRRTTSQDFNPLFQQRERLRLQEQIKALQVISTHSPSKGRDPDRLIPTILQFKFQPTLPAKGETYRRLYTAHHTWYFNPLSQQRERLSLGFCTRMCTLFQPTLPAKGETQDPHQQVIDLVISTHSPSKGRDGRRIWCIT